MASFQVNGTAQRFAGDAKTPVLWYLRDELGLLGTKRLRHGAVRRLHYPPRRRGGAVVHHARLGGRRQTHHHHRRLEPGRQSSGPASL